MINPPTRHYRSKKAAAQEINIVPVQSRRTRTDFLDLPHRVYQNDPSWVAPLRMLEKKRISISRHPFYEHGDGQFWVAYRDSQPVGRIGATINHLHLERFEDALGQFSMIEALDDKQAFAALLGTAEQWLSNRGMQRIAGPFNLSMNDEVGMLVDGFEFPPMALMGHGRPYYENRLTELGYQREIDLFAFYGPIDTRLEGPWMEPLERLAQRADIQVRGSTRRRLASDLRIMFEIYNEAWSQNWGHVPMTDKEISENVLGLWFLVAPELLVIAEIEGRPAGVLLTLPNFNEWISGINGRLLPFGWLKALWSLCVPDTQSGRFILGGVRKDIQNTPVGGALPLLMLRRMRDARRRFKAKFVEGSWVLENNTAILNYYERAGFERYKTYRIFSRSLL